MVDRPGMYVDLDWHSIGNLTTGVFQDPMYDTSLQETYEFWRIMARHFAGHNTVAFFELFNEPTTFRNQLGPVSWDDWKKINENIIAIIRANNAKAIPLVAGFDWAYDLTPLILSPIAAEGIGYVVHPYANKRQRRGSPNGKRTSVSPPPLTPWSPPNSADSRSRLRESLGKFRTGRRSSNTWRARASVGWCGASTRSGVRR